MPAPQLRSLRLILRHWAPDDRRPFALMNSDPEVMRYITIESVYSQYGQEAEDYEAVLNQATNRYPVTNCTIEQKY